MGADWALAETTKVWEWCDADADCKGVDDQGNPTHVCAKHMWKNTKNGEYDSGVGCAWKGACKGTSTWQYYGDSQWVQYFCTDEQAAGAENAPDPFPGIWTQAPAKKVTGDWVDVCSSNEECGKNLAGEDMLCRDYFYDLDNKLTSWDRGKICVGEWILENCYRRSEFMLLNNNYNITNFDYTYSQRCIDMSSSEGSGAQAMAATAIAALAALALLN